MNLLLAVLLVAFPAAAEEAELLNDIEIRREMEKAESGNLENAAASSEAEASKGVRYIRALIAASEAGLEAARVELEAVLRDPEELRRNLAGEEGDLVERVDAQHEALLMAGQLLTAKVDKFLIKASSVPLSVPEEDRAKLIAFRSSYNPRNRESDLRRARADAAAAKKRLGVQDLWANATEAVTALESCVAEVKGAAEQAQQAAAVLDGRGRRAELFAGVRETLVARGKSLQADAKDLEREIEILKANLLLQKADRQITGATTK